jgi:hypothetical protein
VNSHWRVQKAGANVCSRPARSSAREVVNDDLRSIPAARSWSCERPLSAHLARSRECWRTSLHRTHNSRSPPGDGTGAPRPALIDLPPVKPPEGKLDGGEGDEGGEGFREVLKVPSETPVASEPGEGALDHPTARQNDEALRVVAPLDDLRAQQRHLCHRSYNLPGVVAAISPDQFEPREAPGVSC